VSGGCFYCFGKSLVISYICKSAIKLHTMRYFLFLAIYCMHISANFANDLAVNPAIIGAGFQSDTFVKPNKYWFYTTYTNLTGPPSYIWTDANWIGGDTVINGQTYAKLHSSRLKNMPASAAFHTWWWRYLMYSMTQPR
jgi:ABC-type transport system involved in multi-copper enzyme maturation permease subunit